MIEIDGKASDRFGVICGRLDTAALREADLWAVDALARELGVAMLSARIEVGRLPLVRALEADGFRLMDTLLYYGRPSAGTRRSFAAAGNVLIRRARAQDAQLVGSVARLAFRGYLGHFHADPRLDDDAATEAYAEWAETLTKACDDDSVSAVAVVGGAVAGFILGRQNDPGETEIVLNAIDPEHQARGLYAALLSEVMAQADTVGSERVIVSTQVNNYAVQRVWTRLGFVHERSLYTFHKWYD